MKKVLTLLALATFTSQVYATTYKGIKCEYVADYEDISYEATFAFKGNLTVNDSKNAVLDYVTVLDVVSEGEVYAGLGKQVSNVPYNARKYKGYYKFNLDIDSPHTRWGRATASLIILPLPVSTTISRNGVKFKAVLDVSYDDHHGDYVPLACDSY